MGRDSWGGAWVGKGARPLDVYTEPSLSLGVK